MMIGALRIKPSQNDGHGFIVTFGIDSELGGDCANALLMCATEAIKLIASQQNSCTCRTSTHQEIRPCPQSHPSGDSK